MHIDSQSLLACALGAHLAASFARLFVHAPKQQAQIDALEAKVDAVLALAQPLVAAAAPAPTSPQGDPQ